MDSRTVREEVGERTTPMDVPALTLERPPRLPRSQRQPAAAAARTRTNSSTEGQQTNLDPVNQRSENLLGDRARAPPNVEVGLVRKHVEVKHPEDDPRRKFLRRREQPDQQDGLQELFVQPSFL